MKGWGLYRAQPGIWRAFKLLFCCKEKCLVGCCFIMPWLQKLNPDINETSNKSKAFFCFNGSCSEGQQETGTNTQTQWVWLLPLATQSGRQSAFLTCSHSHCRFFLSLPGVGLGLGGLLQTCTDLRYSGKEHLFPYHWVSFTCAS